jgi:hypothetical protein
MNKVTGLLVAGASLAVAHWAGAVPLLNELVVNDISTDDHEFVEICGNMGEDLSSYTLVVIEGEGTPAGTIDVAIPLTGVVPASGLFVVGDAAVSPDLLTSDGWIENGGETILIVQNFSSSVGTDVDTDNDGVADISIGTIIDAVGLGTPSAGDLIYYNAPFIGPDTGDGGTSDFDPAGLVRCQDCNGTWGMICLNGTEPTGPGCDVTNPYNPYFVAYATPGAPNACGTVAVEPDNWGKVKAQYR